MKLIVVVLIGMLLGGATVALWTKLSRGQRLPMAPARQG